MLLVVLGIIIIILGIILGESLFYDWAAEIMFEIVGILLGIVVILTGVLAPLSGYDDYKVTEEITLSPMKLDNDNSCYVAVNINNEYAFKVAKEEDTYKTIYVDADSNLVKVRELDEITNPRVVILVAKPKKSILTFASTNQKAYAYQYVFEVPTGTVYQTIE